MKRDIKQTQPLKEYEPHGSIYLPRDMTLDDIFREAAREGTLYE
jgi:hypothetical protein